MDCRKNPDGYAFTDCDDFNADHEQQWNRDRLFLEGSTPGAVCGFAGDLPCRVIVLNEKAIDTYSHYCGEGGCTTAKYYIFYHGPYRYEVFIARDRNDVLPDFYISQKETTPLTQALISIVKSMRFE